MKTALRLNHVSLHVSSLDASAAFYQDVLKLPEIANGTRKPHIRWFGLGNGQSVHLIGGGPGNTSPVMSTHFCIASADFEGMLQHLAAMGTRYCNLAGEGGKQHLRADGVRSVYLQDPDKYWIEVNEDF